MKIWFNYKKMIILLIVLRAKDYVFSNLSAIRITICYVIAYIIKGGFYNRKIAIEVIRRRMRN